ncbi:MAG: dihydrolipoyllysine-residue acetyltransferase [Pseudobdellovibrionaceae bacterium]
MKDIKLPELGEGVTEGELVKWLVKPGDQVKPDQAIAEVMTDKATVEVPSTIAGTVKELKFKVGEIIKVESIMITLDEGSAAATTKPTAASSATTSHAKIAPAASVQTSNSTHSAISSSGTTFIKLPELGEGVTEGELVKWLVKPGDQVKPDQSIAEVMTDKATVEFPSTIAGTVKELKFKVGEIIKVESVMITLEGSTASATKSQTPSQPTHSNTPQQPQAAAAMVMKPATTSASTTSNTNGLSTYTDSIYPPVADSRVLATPATRRYAREMNVDINQIQGTGLAGRVTQEDVLKAKSGSATSQVGKPSSAITQIPKPGYQSTNQVMEERVALRGVRKKIAENLQMSKAIIPHFTLMDEANVTDLVALRGSLKEAAEKAKTKITYLPFVIKALIATMREFPTFNASIDDAQSEIVYKKYFNIGFAADTPNGLLVPVIKNADHKSILEISKEIIDLSTRARDGKLKPDEMKGATITITNIGSVGGTYATPIINHPEVAILGMYKIQEKPVIKNGQLAAIQVMNYTVTCDHRLIDGAVAANFLKAFIQRLENPGRLMLDMM